MWTYEYVMFKLYDVRENWSRVKNKKKKKNDKASVRLLTDRFRVK